MPAAPIATPTRRGRQRGRVVDAVADHRDRAGLALERRARRELVLGQQPGAPLRRRRRRAATARATRLAVAGEHDDAVARRRAAARRRRRAASGRGWSASPNAASDAVALAEHDRGLARRLQPRGRLGGSRRALGRQTRTAGPQRAAVDACLGAAAGKRRERVAAGDVEPALARGAHAAPRPSGCSEPSLDGGDERQRIVLGSRAVQRDVASCGVPDGERAGLVDGDGAHAREVLERLRRP